MSLCRSIGGAIGVAMIGAIIFVSIGRTDGALEAVLDRVMGEGPEYLHQLSAADRTAIGERLDWTFRIVFFTIGAITGIGALLATTVPKPKF